MKFYRCVCPAIQSQNQMLAWSLSVNDRKKKPNGQYRNEFVADVFKKIEQSAWYKVLKHIAFILGLISGMLFAFWKSLCRRKFQSQFYNHFKPFILAMHTKLNVKYWNGNISIFHFLFHAISANVCNEIPIYDVTIAYAYIYIQNDSIWKSRNRFFLKICMHTFFYSDPFG